MFKIVQRSSLGVLYFMIIPLFLWIQNWKWQLKNNAYLKFWYYLTASVDLPWNCIINILFISWFIWCLRNIIHQYIYNVMIILFSVILLGQSIKLLIKNIVYEHRPFIVWIEKKYDKTNHTQCTYMSYQMYRNIIISEIQKIEYIPICLKNYWISKSDFSFPSGHTIFVTSWSLLALEFIWTRCCKILVILLMLWSNSIIISRLILGMHWPHDIIISVIISWILIILVNWIIRYEYLRI